MKSLVIICFLTKLLQYYDHIPHVIIYIPVACFIPGGYFKVIFIYVNFIYEVQTLQNGLHNLSEFDCNLVCQCFSPTISLQLYPIANRSDLPIFFNLLCTLLWFLIHTVLCEIIILPTPSNS